MELTVVYPHQLFADHPSLNTGRAVALIEDPLFFGTDPHWPMQVHRQRLLLHRCSMALYAESLRARGFTVLERRHLQAPDTQGHLQALFAMGYKHFHLADPVDDVLSRRLNRFAEQNGCNLTITATPMLLTPDSVINEHFATGRKPLMAKFYEMQRKRLNVLLEVDGGPVGGRWSFDADNRKKLPKGIVVPQEPTASSAAVVDRSRQELEQENLPLIGRWDLFAYPLDHKSADAWLQTFLSERLRDFGSYEDAISTQHRVMWHSVLTPMLNIGLLTPQQVVDRTLERAAEGDVPLNSLEGFIRQIIGWREYVRGFYWHQMPHLQKANALNAQRGLPEFYWTGETDMACLADCIRTTRDNAHAHHIQRLMVLGNFALMAGISPREVQDWYLVVYADAYEWVELPNVAAMILYADGGKLASKPYAASGNYINKMSNYCSGCIYSPAKKTGEGACPFNPLYWHFMHRHRDRLEKNHRIGRIYATWDRMGDERQQDYLDSAELFIDSLEPARPGWARND